MSDPAEYSSEEEDADDMTSEQAEFWHLYYEALPAGSAYTYLEKHAPEPVNPEENKSKSYSTDDQVFCKDEVSNVMYHLTFSLSDYGATQTPRFVAPDSVHFTFWWDGVPKKDTRVDFKSISGNGPFSKLDSKHHNAFKELLEAAIKLVCSRNPDKFVYSPEGLEKLKASESDAKVQRKPFRHADQNTWANEQQSMFPKLVRKDNDVYLQMESGKSVYKCQFDDHENADENDDPDDEHIVMRDVTLKGLGLADLIVNIHQDPDKEAYRVEVEDSEEEFSYLFSMTKDANSKDGQFGASFAELLSNNREKAKEIFGDIKARVTGTNVLSYQGQTLREAKDMITLDFLASEMRPLNYYGAAVWFEVVAPVDIHGGGDKRESRQVRLIAYRLKGKGRVASALLGLENNILVGVWDVENELLLHAAWLETTVTDPETIANVVGLIGAGFSLSGEFKPEVKYDTLSLKVSPVEVDEEISGKVSNWDDIVTPEGAKVFGSSFKSFFKKTLKSPVFKQVSKMALQVAKPIVTTGVTAVAGREAATLANLGMEELTKQFGSAPSTIEEIVRASDVSDEVIEIPSMHIDLIQKIEMVLDQTVFPYCVPCSASSCLCIIGLEQDPVEEAKIILEFIGEDKFLEGKGVSLSEIVMYLRQENPGGLNHARAMLPSAETIKAEIAQNRPVMCGMEFDRNIAEFDGENPIKDITTGGFFHCVTIVGYDDADSTFTILNSWGKNWGVSGMFQILQNYGGIEEAWVFEKREFGQSLEAFDVEEGKVIMENWNNAMPGM